MRQLWQEVLVVRVLTHEPSDSWPEALIAAQSPRCAKVLVRPIKNGGIAASATYTCLTAYRSCQLIDVTSLEVLTC
jgi:hypothetical protein